MQNEGGKHLKTLEEVNRTLKIPARPTDNRLATL